MGYGLPKSVEINDQNFSIRYDFRVILTIFEVLDDEELSDEERAYTALRLFFVDFDSIPDYDEAIKQLFWFINGGQYPDDKKKEPEIIDWAKDFQFIVSPVNRVLGKEIRESEYDPDTNTGGTHWFTFLSAYLDLHGVRTSTFYCSSMECTLEEAADDNEVWGGATFNLIEV